MDYPDVAQVIHLGPPNEVETHVEDTGRAGRNGSLALALLLSKSRRERDIWKRV